MAYDQKLAARARRLLESEEGFEERKMFGGIYFLIKGNMACGILNDELIVRVGPADYDKLLLKPILKNSILPANQ